MQAQQTADKLQVVEIDRGAEKLEERWQLKGARIQQLQMQELEAMLLKGARRRDELELRKIEDLQQRDNRWRNISAVRVLSARLLSASVSFTHRRQRNVAGCAAHSRSCRDAAHHAECVQAAYRRAACTPQTRVTGCYSTPIIYALETDWFPSEATVEWLTSVPAPTARVTIGTARITQLHAHVY